MKQIAELCKPRDSVFADTTRDDVLNLSDLAEGNVDGEKFFAENYRTKGMETLFDIAFRRFKGESQTGVIKLTQAMGGGKTHNMIALALIAKDPVLREKILGPGYDGVGEIKVVAFSGRESDVPFGIWGAIADQLGKREMFKDLYVPLRAPGESAWINLLKGENTLILIDELPPYLEYARSVAVGDSNLCNVTVTALSNLFSALGKEQLANVCLVFSDLKATYESGSEMVQKSFKELEHEANRIALNIEPVALNSDEIYDILRTRLFARLPKKDSEDVKDIAAAYKEALEGANKSGLTTQSPASRYTGIIDSYPFHPSIKDLYARFKENPNFQQTRGLIRLMRQIVRQFFESGQAQSASLISVYDINLNNATMLGFINEIKSSLANAINHDLAQGGKSVAEDIDRRYNLPRPYAQNVAKLIFMASLNDVALGVNGLTKQEILGYLCEPGADLEQYTRALTEIDQQSWYLKMDNRGRYYYQNTKNMVAQMNTLVESYSNEKAKAELIKVLEGLFRPETKTCYENLYVMPALDEVRLDRNKVSLIIFEPYAGSGLHPDIEEFYENTMYKNRVMFLSGEKSMMDNLYARSKDRMAVEQLLHDMEAEHVPESDQQYTEALGKRDSAYLALYSAIVQTFVTLYFPTKAGLNSEEIRLEFRENRYDGEKQVIAVLRDTVTKYQDFSSDERTLETIRQRCEARLFTQKELPWNTILERAAAETSWPWYHPDQMEAVKAMCIRKDLWREIDGYMTKGPFPKEPTSVLVEMVGYNRESHEFTLGVRGVYGSTVYYEVGAEPSTASSIAPNPFITKETDLYFLCVDETSGPDGHPTGDAVHYLCKAPLRHEFRRNSKGQNILQLEANPRYKVRYTTDGSNPKESGGLYEREIVLPDDCRFVGIAVYSGDTVIEEKTISVDKKADRSVRINDMAPLTYTLTGEQRFLDTQSAYAQIDALKNIPGVTVGNGSLTLTNAANTGSYFDISMVDAAATPDMLEEAAKTLDSLASAWERSNLEFHYKELRFETGADFRRWVDMTKQSMDEVSENGRIRQ